MTTSDNSGNNRTEKDYEWFGDSIHYWTDESLQFAYAFACVDIVIKKSVRAKHLYIKMVESWNNQNLKSTFKDFYDEMASLLTNEQKEVVQNAVISPERYVGNDIDKSLKPLKDVLQDEDVREYVLGLLVKPNLIEKHGEFSELIDFIALIFEFVIIGFNRKADIENDKYKVLPGDDNSWLLYSILFMTAMVHYKLTMSRVIQMYKIRIYRKKIVNFEDVLTKQPTSRMHRRIVVDAKNAKLYMMHDAKVYQAAERWYQCRVLCAGIEDYCNKQADKGIMLDSKNIGKEIRHCDEAMGYLRRKRPKVDK